MSATILTIDTKALSICTKEGAVVGFRRFNGEWIGELQSYYDVPPDDMEADRFLWKMVRLWNEEIYRAAGFLTLAGTTFYGSHWVKSMALELGRSTGEIQQWVDRETPIIMSDDVWPALLKLLLKHQNAATDDAVQGKITQALLFQELAAGIDQRCAQVAMMIGLRCL